MQTEINTENGFYAMILIQLFISTVHSPDKQKKQHTLLVPESRSVSFSISRRISLKSV